MLSESLPYTARQGMKDGCAVPEAEIKEEMKQNKSSLRTGAKPGAATGGPGVPSSPGRGPLHCRQRVQSPGALVLENQ